MLLSPFPSTTSVDYTPGVYSIKERYTWNTHKGKDPVIVLRLQEIRDAAKAKIQHLEFTHKRLAETSGHSVSITVSIVWRDTDCADRMADFFFDDLLSDIDYRVVRPDDLDTLDVDAYVPDR